MKTHVKEMADGGDSDDGRDDSMDDSDDGTFSSTNTDDGTFLVEFGDEDGSFIDVPEAVRRGKQTVSQYLDTLSAEERLCPTHVQQYMLWGKRRSTTEGRCCS